MNPILAQENECIYLCISAILQKSWLNNGVTF